MKVVLVNPPSEGTDDDHLEPQLGLLYIASVLREEGKCDVQIYEMTGCKNDYQISEKIENIPYAEIYGFTTYCTNYKYIKKCINYLRGKNPTAFIILGGPNATALPEFTLTDSGCDFIIRGEGEDAFLYLVTEITKLPVRNDYYINLPIHQKIIDGWGRENLDDYPLPAWDLIDLNTFNRVLEGERVISIISSRGCKYNCTHCNSVIMGGGSKGKNKVRYRSPDNVIKELKLLKSKGFTRFRFNDDIFTVNPNIVEFLNKIKDLNITFRIFGRIENLTDAVCRMLSEAGCRHIAIGLESLNPQNLRFLKKQTQIGIEEKHLNNVHKYGMKSRVYFIVGLPFDTDDTIKQYFTIASELPFDEFTCYPLIPYPGTKIWTQPEQYNYIITDTDFTNYFQIGANKRTCYALRHKNFNEDKVKQWVNYVNDLFEQQGMVHTGKSKVAK